MKKTRATVKSNKRKKLIVVLMMLIIIVILIITVNKKQIISNSGISSERKEHQKIAGAYTDVVSLDGITVPVPTGYTASSVPEEQ